MIERVFGSMFLVPSKKYLVKAGESPVKDLFLIRMDYQIIALSATARARRKFVDRSEGEEFAMRRGVAVLSCVDQAHQTERAWGKRG